VATSSITHTVKDASGTGLAGISVIATLSGPAFLTSDGSQVATRKEYVTDGNGLVTLVLQKNADLTPATTHWRVEVLLSPKHGGPQRHTILSTVNQTLLASLTVT